MGLERDALAGQEMREFTLAEFVGGIAGMVESVQHETHKALERAARVIEREAKKEIGHYQDEAAPFVGWAELADRTKADRVAQGYPENEPLLRDGTLRDSIGHVVQGHEAAIGSNSDIAVYQELGTGHIPPRSFLGGAAVRKETEVVKIIGEGAVIGLVGAEVVGRYLPVRE